MGGVTLRELLLDDVKALAADVAPFVAPAVLREALARRAAAVRPNIMAVAVSIAVVARFILLLLLAATAFIVVGK